MFEALHQLLLQYPELAKQRHHLKGVVQSNRATGRAVEVAVLQAHNTCCCVPLGIVMCPAGGTLPLASAICRPQGHPLVSSDG